MPSLQRLLTAYRWQMHGRVLQLEGPESHRRQFPNTGASCETASALCRSCKWRRKARLGVSQLAGVHCQAGAHSLDVRNRCRLPRVIRLQQLRMLLRQRTHIAFDCVF